MNARGNGAGAGGVWARNIVFGLALLATLTLTGCSLNLGTHAPAPSGQAHLTDLPWCDQPLVSFQDDSQPSQQPTSHWTDVQGALGFTAELPPTLPTGSCLDLAGGSIHDPIFGGHLSITWVLPKTGPISFSEAPKRAAVATTPQCAQSDQGSAATTICVAVVGDASVTIAAHMPVDTLKTYFSKLQPNVDWTPTGDMVATATPTR